MKVKSIFWVVSAASIIVSIFACFADFSSLRLIQVFLLVIAAIMFAVVAYNLPKGDIKEIAKLTKKKKTWAIILTIIGIVFVVIVPFFSKQQSNQSIENVSERKQADDDSTDTSIGNEVKLSPTSNTDFEPTLGITPAPTLYASYTPTQFLSSTPESTSTSIITPTYQSDIIDAYLQGEEYYKNKDYQHAFPLLLKAAKGGYPNAEYYIGCCYQSGTGTNENPTTAFDWFSIAAEHGQDMAQCSLGECYVSGYGVKVNNDLAFEWFLESANKSNKFGLLWVGYCYHHGLGVTQNYDLAMQYYVAARDQGHSYAQRRINELREDMQN